MGLEGIDEPDEQALYVNPYDAGAASEGTQDRYQRMVSRRRITAPGQHRPMDGAAAKPIIDGVAKKAPKIPGRDGQMQSGKQWQMEARNGSTPQTTTTA